MARATFDLGGGDFVAGARPNKRLQPPATVPPSYGLATLTRAVAAAERQVRQTAWIMGYELHITCATSWLDAESTPIRSDLWNQVVAADQSLRSSKDDYFERKDGKGGTVRIPAVLWASDPEVAFWFDRGEITVKHASDATIVKMIELASALNGRVFGDDDEEYLLSDSPPGYVVRREAPAREPSPCRPWWKFW